MKELAGALMNNFYMMNTKLTQLYVLAIPVVIAAYIATGNQQLGMFVPFIIILALPSASLENAATPFATRWTAFENSWGLAPHLMVISRYILYVILSVIGLAFWAVLPFDFYAGQFTLANFVIAGQLMCIAYYPVMYLLNPKHESLGIITLFGSMFLAIAMTFGLDRLAGDNYFLMAAVVAALYVVSAVISVGFNAMHRGRVA